MSQTIDKIKRHSKELTRIKIKAENIKELIHSQYS